MKRTYSVAFRHPCEEKSSSTTEVVETIAAWEQSDRLLKRKCGCNPYKNFVRAGPFVLGLRLSEVTQFSDIENFVARRMDDRDPNRYYFLKIAILSRDKQTETDEQRQSKLLIFNEYSVLSLLKKEKGIIQAEGLYRDYYYKPFKTEPTGDYPKCEKCLRYIDEGIPWQTALLSPNREEIQNERGNIPSELDHHYLDCEYLNRRGTFWRRIILALDCHIPNVYCPVTPTLPHLSKKFTRMNCEYENLQDYVKRHKQIPEMTALLIMAEVVEVIFKLHEINIAHRDLRLENILYNHRNGKVLIINFGLARYVINDTTCINDHRGSSAYISPDVLKKRPYPPKASDCWALGVIFYTMLFGKFPFYADNYSDLFKKINSGNFRLPQNVILYHGPPIAAPGHQNQSKFGGSGESSPIFMSSDTILLIRSLIVTESTKRTSIGALRKKINSIIEGQFVERRWLKGQTLIKNGKYHDDEFQVVPDIVTDTGKTFAGGKIKSPETRNTKFSVLMHDHNYSQKNRSATESNLYVPGSSSSTTTTTTVTDPNQPFSEFNTHLTSSRFASSRLPVPFIPLQFRFANDNSESVHTPEFAPTSLLEEEMLHQLNVSPLRSELSGNRSTAGVSGSGSHRFTVTKVDSDIRPLNEHEFHLVNQHLQQHFYSG